MDKVSHVLKINGTRSADTNRLSYGVKLNNSNLLKSQARKITSLYATQWTTIITIYLLHNSIKNSHVHFLTSKIIILQELFFFTFRIYIIVGTSLKHLNKVRLLIWTGNSKLNVYFGFSCFPVFCSVISPMIETIVQSENKSIWVRVYPCTIRPWFHRNRIFDISSRPLDLMNLEDVKCTLPSQ